MNANTKDGKWPEEKQEVTGETSWCKTQPKPVFFFFQQFKKKKAAQQEVGKEWLINAEKY